MSQIHENLLLEHEITAELNEGIIFMDYAMKEEHLYELLKDYLLTNIQENTKLMDREVILSTLSHVEQELNRQAAFRKDLAFAIVGAIVGAALTFAGAYLSSILSP